MKSNSYYFTLAQQRGDRYALDVAADDAEKLRAQLAALVAAARAVVDPIGNRPGLEKIVSWKNSHVRVLVSSEPLADLAALLLEAEGAK